MAKFEEVLATVYPVASAILEHLGFWDVYSLALTNRGVRDTVLERTAAFTHCDLRDEYSVAALDRITARDRATLPLASKWSTREGHLKYFLTVAETSYPEHSLHPVRLAQCLSVRVRELVLDGIRIDFDTLSRLLHAAEPSVQLLSLVGVSGTSPEQFVAFFAQLAWPALRKLNLWGFGDTEGAHIPSRVQMVAQDKNVQLDVVWQSPTDPQPLLAHRCPCDLCGATYSLTNPRQQTCQICASNYCPDCISRRYRGQDDAHIRVATLICPKCEEMDTLLKCDRDGCTNGWLFQYGVLPPPPQPHAFYAQSPPSPPPPKLCVYGHDDPPCNHCGRWLCAECTQAAVQVMVHCDNCWNVTCSPCLLVIVATAYLASVPTSDQYWPETDAFIEAVLRRHPRASRHSLRLAWDRMLACLPPPPTPTSSPRILSPISEHPSPSVPYPPSGHLQPSPPLHPHDAPLPPTAPPIVSAPNIPSPPPPPLPPLPPLSLLVMLEDENDYNDAALALADTLNSLRGRPYAPTAAPMLGECAACEQSYLCNDCLGPLSAATRAPPGSSTPLGWCELCSRPHLFYSDRDADRDELTSSSGRCSDAFTTDSDDDDDSDWEDDESEGEEEDDDEDEDLEHWDGGKDEALELQAEMLDYALVG